MKTFIVTSTGNYGALVSVVNAESIAEADILAEESHYVWSGYTIKEWDTTIKQIKHIEDE